MLKTDNVGVTGGNCNIFHTNVYYVKHHYRSVVRPCICFLEEIMHGRTLNVGFAYVYT